MCVTNIYIDRYPDGRDVEYERLVFCKYSRKGVPCSEHYAIEHKPRRIRPGDYSAREILSYASPPAPAARRPQDMQTPPLSSESSPRASYIEPLPADEPPRSRRSSAYTGNSRLDPSRASPRRHHKQERVVYADAPPTPKDTRSPRPKSWAPAAEPIPEKQAAGPKTPSASPPRVTFANEVDTNDVDTRPIVINAPRSSPRDDERSDRSRSPQAQSQSQARERTPLRSYPAADETAALLVGDEAAERAERRRRHDEEIRRRPAVPRAPRPLSVPNDPRQVGAPEGPSGQPRQGCPPKARPVSWAPSAGPPGGRRRPLIRQESDRLQVIVDNEATANQDGGVRINVRNSAWEEFQEDPRDRRERSRARQISAEKREGWDKVLEKEGACKTEKERGWDRVLEMNKGIERRLEKERESKLEREMEELRARLKQRQSRQSWMVERVEQGRGRKGGRERQSVVYDEWGVI